LHRYIRFSLFFSCLFTVATAVHGQKVDSSLVIPKAYPHYGSYHDMEQGMNNLKTVDTGLYQMQKYDPGYLHNLGSPGTPAFAQVWDPFKTTGFDLGFHQWDTYTLNDENIRFYNTQNPYANFFYVQGDKDFQAFSGTFAQNLKPYLNYSVHFNLINTNAGYYDPQVTSLGSFDLNTWYQSPDSRYMLIVSAVFNKFSADENGGIISDSAFKNSSTSNRTLLPVNLGAYSLLPADPTGAKQTYLEDFITIRQYYRTGPVSSIKIHDTDSLATKVMRPEYFISHTFQYHLTRYGYNDSFATAPFSYSLVDPYRTTDNYEADAFTDQIAIGHAVFNHPVQVNKKIDSSAMLKNAVFWQAFIKYTYINASQNVRQLSDIEHYDNTSLGFELSDYRRFGFDLNGEYFIEGYNQFDYLLNAHLYSPFIREILPQFNVDFKVQQSAPSYTDQLFYGNHFLWENDFRKTKSESLSAYFSDVYGFKLGASIITAADLIYYDTLSMPHQDHGSVDFANVFVNKQLNIGRHLHFLNNVTFQKPLAGGYDVRVPEWLIKTSWFYDHYLFKHAVLLQSGFDFSYNTAYYGYGYMPEISKFYLQDKILIGNYQVFDVWVAAKIKRLNAFLKIEHVNEGLSGNWYFLAPHYPMYPTVLRFGIKWSFYN